MSKPLSGALSAIACVIIGMLTSAAINKHRAARETSIESRLQLIEAKLSATNTFNSEQPASVDRLLTIESDIADIRGLRDYDRTNIATLFHKDLEWLRDLDQRLRELDRHFAKAGPEPDQFSIAHTSVGPVLVSVKDISPYLDGYKVKATIGNPSTATLNNCRIEVKWPNGTNGFRTNFVSQTIAAASWNPMEFTITPATAVEARRIFLGFDVHSVVLNTEAPTR